MESHRIYNSFGLLTDEFKPDIDPVTGSPIGSGTATSVDLDYGFTGKFHDDLTGLTHHQHRWFDPALGKWISEDPLGFAAGDINTTRYVHNTPLTYTDPTGLFAEGLGDGNQDSGQGGSAGGSGGGHSSGGGASGSWETGIIIGIHSGTDGSGGGHSWISFYNPENNVYVTYGLYPDSHAGVIRRGLDDRQATDVRINFEENFGEGDNHRYFNAKPEQLDRFNEFIEQEHHWSANHTCAEWASQCWQHSTGEHLDPNGFLGYETPSALSESIQSAESRDPTNSPRPNNGTGSPGRPNGGNNGDDGTSCCG